MVNFELLLPSEVLNPSSPLLTQTLHDVPPDSEGRRRRAAPSGAECGQQKAKR